MRWDPRPSELPASPNPTIRIAEADATGHSSAIQYLRSNSALSGEEMVRSWDWVRWILPDDFDNMAVVVDWLDACRNENLELLLDCFAEDARLSCSCDGVDVFGRAGLTVYWKQRLKGFSPAAFGLEEITPVAEGVILEYLNHEGKPVKVVFSFNSKGKIAQMCCEPASA
jgi:hypothetical protein